MSDLRDSLTAAYESNESATPAPEPAAAPTDTPAPVESAPAESTTPAPESGRARDAQGRFAPKSATPAPNPAESTPTEAPKATAPTGTEQPSSAAATPTAPELRAPQSWKPEIREKWNALPDEVKREVLRREKEASTALQEAATPRKFHEQFQQAVAPFQAMLQAEGTDPIRAVQNLMQTAYALRTAPPAQKAALVAQIVKGYGVDIQALDAVLSGEAVPQQTHQPAQPVVPRDPRLDILLQQMQQRQHQQLAQELSTFASKPEAEFLEDVRGDMADLLDMAHKRGVAMTLEQAYSRACLLNPEVSKVLEQRKAAQAAATATAATQQARAAASSVRSQPAVPVAGDKPKDLRSTLEAAFEATAGR